MRSSINILEEDYLTLLAYAESGADHDFHHGSNIDDYKVIRDIKARVEENYLPVFVAVEYYQSGYMMHGYMQETPVVVDVYVADTPDSLHDKCDAAMLKHFDRYAEDWRQSEFTPHWEESIPSGIQLDERNQSYNFAGLWKHTFYLVTNSHDGYHGLSKDEYWEYRYFEVYLA